MLCLYCLVRLLLQKCYASPHLSFVSSRRSKLFLLTWTIGVYIFVIVAHFALHFSPVDVEAHEKRRLTLSLESEMGSLTSIRLVSSACLLTEKILQMQTPLAYAVGCFRVV